jgi:hypothetical protein
MSEGKGRMKFLDITTYLNFLHLGGVDSLNDQLSNTIAFVHCMGKALLFFAFGRKSGSHAYPQSPCQID